jgi:hypothetical protein
LCGRSCSALYINQYLLYSYIIYIVYTFCFVLLSLLAISIRIRYSHTGRAVPAGLYFLRRIWNNFLHPLPSTPPLPHSSQSLISITSHHIAALCSNRLQRHLTCRPVTTRAPLSPVAVDYYPADLISLSPSRTSLHGVVCRPFTIRHKPIAACGVPRPTTLYRRSGIRNNNPASRSFA